jgi:hypothetical protein
MGLILFSVFTRIASLNSVNLLSFLIEKCCFLFGLKGLNLKSQILLEVILSRKFGFICMSQLEGTTHKICSLSLTLDVLRVEEDMPVRV